MEILRENKDKIGFDYNMSFIRGVSLTFYISFMKPALKKHKKLQNLSSF
jgi:hypothetical protein